MPRAIIGSLLICTVLYILVAGIGGRLVPYIQLGKPRDRRRNNRGFRMAVEGSTIAAIPESFSMIIKFGAVLGLSSTMVVQIARPMRIFYAMGKDGLLRRGRRRSTTRSPRTSPP